MLFKTLPILCMLVSALLFGEQVETFYGEIDVEEPVLLELIHSPAMQRLKEINQYGVATFTTHMEKYTRYDHSIGVFAILRKNEATLEEQISGLLHDVSHTVFSHTGDWVFGKEYQEQDYQSMIYKIYLSNSGIEDILIKHGYTIDQINPKNKQFNRLEQPLPNLCADRIDYNLQGAYHQNFLTKEEVLELFDDLQFIEGKWVGTRIDLLSQLARFPIFMTRDCWGSAANYALSRWLADAIIKGLATGLLSWKEVHFGVDSVVWNKLSASKDSYIQQRMHMIANYNDYFRWVDQQDADVLVKFRCRGIDPWVYTQGQIVRLTLIDTQLGRELDTLRKQAAEGWPIKLYSEHPDDYFGP